MFFWIIMPFRMKQIELITNAVAWVLSVVAQGAQFAINMVLGTIVLIARKMKSKAKFHFAR
jgi:hypothetical protein